MSGTMMPPGGPGGGAGLSPQVIQALLQQRMQQQQGAGMPGGGGGPMPGPAPQGGGQGPMMPPPSAGRPMAPPGAAGGAAGGPPPMGPNPMGGVPQGPGAMGGAPQMAPQGGPRMTPQEMAAKGRFGDQIVGHLTPGEIEVPPQIQTPQLMEVLKQAFAKAGVSPSQFTAGSPAESHNPATGAPEYSLLAALLPILGGIGGSFIAPGIGSAIGGALGGAAGGAIDHLGGAGTALSALGGGAGGYLAGGGLGGQASQTTPFGSGLSAAANPELNTSAAATEAAPWAPYGDLRNALKGGLGAGLGSTIGGALAPPPNQSSNNGLPPGFNNPMPPLNPNFQALLGNNQSPRASFAGYDPYQAAAGHPYNIYSPAGNGT